MESSQSLLLAADGHIAGPSTPFPAPTAQHIQGVTSNQGDVNLAGRDVHVHKHYHSYPDRVDITAVLGAIRNLRKVHLDVLSKATDGTGVWLLRNEKFLIWLDPNGDLKILWGIGIPGAGKTVLASIVIRDLEARAEAAGGRICVCYVYIRYSDRADLTVRNVLEIIVKQTVERHAECKMFAEQAYARHLREQTQPTEAELLQLLHQFTEVTEATFYFLDALDEAPDKVQIELVKKLASLNVRLFITSRPLEAVQAQASNTHCFPIIAQDDDLELHINQEIASSRALTNLLEKAGTSLRDEIVVGKFGPALECNRGWLFRESVPTGYNGFVMLERRWMFVFGRSSAVRGSIRALLRRYITVTSQLGFVPTFSSLRPGGRVGIRNSASRRRNVKRNWG